jgi:hypothetical protein
MAGIRKILTTTYLRGDLATAVAAVAVAWSNLELELEHTIRDLAKIPHKTARVLVTGMNARTRLGCIEGLIQLKDSLAPALAQEFKKILMEVVEKVESERNKVVHAVWHRDAAGEYSLVRTSGVWTPPGIKGKVKRAVQAELDPIDSAKVRAIQVRIEGLTQHLHDWCAKVD